MEQENTILNDDWIKKFEETDKLYQDFYKDDIYYINLKIIYINKANEIEKIKEESFLMKTPNCISKEEIIRILKNNSIDNQRRYTLLSILKYIITLEPNDIKDFLIKPENFDFLNIKTNIDDILFEKTISMFQDLNDLILIFREKKNEDNDKNNTMKNRHSLSSKKKTIKKIYRD